MKFFIRLVCVEGGATDRFFLKGACHMKNFFLPLILAFAILIPTVQAQAADVPGFYQFGRAYLTFTGKEIGKYQPMRVYGYDCDIDLNEEFAEIYMGTLIKKYNFKLIGHYINDYRRGQAKLYEHWVFKYNGSKSVSTFEQKNYADMKNSYYCNLVVGRSKDWNAGITHFSIRIANGLTYGED